MLAATVKGAILAAGSIRVVEIQDKVIFDDCIQPNHASKFGCQLREQVEKGARDQSFGLALINGEPDS